MTDKNGFAECVSGACKESVIFKNGWQLLTSTERHSNNTDLNGNADSKNPNSVPKTINTTCTDSIDNPTLTFDQIRESVSAEIDYDIHFKETAELEKFLHQLCEEVHSRLCQIKRKTKCVTLKVMVRAKDAPLETSNFIGLGVWYYITKSISLTDFTDDIEAITRSVFNTIKSLNLPPNELRGIGIQLTKLDEPQIAREPTENIIKNMFVKMSEKRKENKATLEPAPKARAVNTDRKRETSTENDVPECIVDMLHSTPDYSKETSRDVPGYIEIIKLSPTEEVKGISPDVYTKTGKISLPSYVDAEVLESLPPKMRRAILAELAYRKNKPPSEWSSSVRCACDNYDFDNQPSTSRAALKRRASLDLKRNSN